MNKYVQFGIPAFLLVTMGLLLVPLPAILLDLFLIGNLAVALLVVILSASVNRPSELSVFPALLLVLTFGRLSLNAH